MALGQFLNNPGSLVSVNDTRYFDPDAVTPRVCFFFFFKVREETDFSCRKWFCKLQKLTQGKKKSDVSGKKSTQNGSDSS